MGHQTSQDVSQGSLIHKGITYSCGFLSISWSIIVDRATTPSLTGRHVSPPSSAARGQQPLWLTGPQDGDQTVSNARRHWAGTVKLFCTVEQAKVWGQMDVGLNPRLTTE